MFSIGEFARLGGVSVRMLRHYDALGLLVPAHVDRWNRYRSYDARQLPRLNRIVALKDLGFPLEEVAALLDGDLDATALQALLTQRRDALAEQITADRERLARVERRLRTIEKEGHMSQHDYTVKPLPALRLAERSASVASQQEIGPVVGPLFDEVAGAIQPTGQAVAWYDLSDESIGVHAGFEVGDEVTGAPGEVQVVTLPAVPRAAALVYHGGMEGIGDAWQALATYVADAGLVPNGPCREVYLATPMDAPDQWVTELQQPVA